jgi:hypothetical protein
MNLGSPSESSKPRVAVPSRSRRIVLSNDSSREVLLPFSVSPLGAAALLVGFASPDHLRLQVFSTS